MDDERTGARGPGRWLGWLVVGGLGAAVLAGTVAVVTEAVAQPAPSTEAQPSPTSTPVPTIEPLLPTPTSHVDGPRPEVTGRPVAEAQAAWESVGAVVTVFDGRGWSRPVQPDWSVCTAGELYRGDAPSGEVQITAVPAGDPCP